jgi:hypothetical protein
MHVGTAAFYFLEVKIMISNYTNRQKMPFPILLEAKQIGPNQIFIQYDRPTDLASATNVSNYWIRSNMEHPITATSLVS